MSGGRPRVELDQRLRDAADEIYDRRSYLAFALREHVTAAVSSRRSISSVKNCSGDIRFDLEAGDNFRMFESYEIQVAENDKLLQSMPDSVEPSMRSNRSDEVAFYLDELTLWWHREFVNARVLPTGRERIYPDFAE